MDRDYKMRCWEYQAQRLSEGGRVSFLEMAALGFSTRIVNCCFNEGIHSIDALCERTEAELLRHPNLGRKSLNEIKSVLEEHGRSLNRGRGATDMAKAIERANETRGLLKEAQEAHSASLREIEKLQRGFWIGA